jgi:ferredoxin
MIVSADRSRCVSSGQCAATVPEVFDQGDDDGLVQLLQTEPADEYADGVREAVALCPVAALSVHEG